MRTASIIHLPNGEVQINLNYDGEMVFYATVGELYATLAFTHYETEWIKTASRPYGFLHNTEVPVI